MTERSGVDREGAGAGRTTLTEHRPIAFGFHPPSTIRQELRMAHSDPHANDPRTTGAGSSMPVAPQYQAQPSALATVERPTSISRV
jgi:hypothetical protein